MAKENTPYVPEIIPAGKMDDKAELTGKDFNTFNEQIAEYLNREFSRIANIIPIINNLDFVIYHTEPPDLRTGQVYYADGIDWDPGTGEGLYQRTSTPAWVKL